MAAINEIETGYMKGPKPWMFMYQGSGVVRVPPGPSFQHLLAETPTPERCVEAYHLHRTRLELIAERKLRRRLLTDDGNVEINGRDLRERDPAHRHTR